MIISPLPGNYQSDFRITQLFGENPQIYSRFGLKGHNGIDFAGKVPGDKPECVAVYDAMVSKVGFDPNGFGLYIRLVTTEPVDGRTREIIYGHLDDVFVTAGERVYIGDPIGKIGNTGFSTGVHLHLGMRYRDALTNEVLNYGNGYLGYVDFSPFMLQIKPLIP